jgi:hypothetical protein
VWKKAETLDKVGEDRWPRVIWHHKTTSLRFNDEGEESKKICSMKYVEGEEEESARR